MTTETFTFEDFPAYKPPVYGLYLTKRMEGPEIIYDVLHWSFYQATFIEMRTRQDMTDKVFAWACLPKEARRHPY